MTWRTLKRQGLPRVTRPMLDALRRVAAEDNGIRRDALKAHRLTIQALLRHGLIVRHEATDCYVLTPTGSEAFSVYMLPIRAHRNDGLCPACGKYKRYVLPDGTPSGYCVACRSWYFKQYATRRKRKVFAKVVSQ